MCVQSQIDLKTGEIYAGTPVFLIVLPCLFVLEDSVCLRGSISRRRARGNVLFGAVPSKGAPAFSVPLSRSETRAMARRDADLNAGQRRS